MDTLTAGFPTIGWFRNLSVSEYALRVADYEAFCREHLGEIIFTHDLWLKGDGSGRNTGTADAYFVGQAAFLQVMVLITTSESMNGCETSGWMNGCFMLGGRKQVFYKNIPSSLIVVPTVKTIVNGTRKILQGAGYTVIEQEFGTGEYPASKQVVWLKVDNDGDRVILQRRKEPGGGDESEGEDPLEALFLDAKISLQHEEENDWYVLERGHLVAKFLEESFETSGLGNP